MPTCIVCNSRKFRNKEALHQHLNTSGADHPSCTICFPHRRFISEQAKEEHDAARHPQSYPCVQCDRTFREQFALEDHYRGSKAHPNCVKCGHGFIDIQARDEHHRDQHPQVACGTCHGVLVYQSDLQAHFNASPAHPKCTLCKTGFIDAAALQRHAVDPEAHFFCKKCDSVFTTHLESTTHEKEAHALDEINRQVAAIYLDGVVVDDMEPEEHTIQRATPPATAINAPLQAPSATVSTQPRFGANNQRNDSRHTQVQQNNRPITPRAETPMLGFRTLTNRVHRRLPIPALLQLPLFPESS
ncbi:hypothetical protein H0H81_004814 [Sphagnurus paluster]|uniref:C2H2-type domain-containing protein n=1 Tax=Sphagnurus paluster TaxID=117069 RepID=A0A9P7KME5_9AGAR|nr:hypothetical protein H0H81_004814 [Sphagnurus paluster]